MRFLTQSAFAFVRRAVRGGITEFLIVAAGNASGAAAIFVGLKLLTRQLRPEAFGMFSLSLTSLTFFVQLVFGPVASTAIRFTSQTKDSEEERVCYIGIQWLLSRAVCAALAAVCIAHLIVLGLNRDALPLVTLAAVAGILSGLISVVESCLSAKRRRIEVAVSTGCGQVLRNGLAVAAAAGATSAISPLVGYSFGCLAHFLLVSWLWWRRHPRAGEFVGVCQRNELVPKIASYSRSFFVWGVPSAFYMISDRWSLASLNSNSGVAIYAVAQQCMQQPVNFGFSILFLFIGPRLYSSDTLAGSPGGTAPSQIVHSGAWLLSIGGLLGFGIVSIFQRNVIIFSANTEYLGAAAICGPVFLAAYLFQLGQWESQIQMVASRTDRLIFPKVATCLAGIVLNFLGARVAGPMGVAISGVITAFAYTVWIKWDAKSLLGTSHASKGSW